MRRISSIIVHCSDSPWGSAKVIDKWHKQKGWREIGYHFVVLNGKPLGSFLSNRFDSLDGSIEVGRDLDYDLFLEEVEIGAHTLGYNKDSIGICLIGTHVFTIKQYSSLLCLLEECCTVYKVPFSRICGHYETISGREQGKTCPNIDMEVVRKQLTGVMRYA